MAKARKKSAEDVSRQFDRIWHAGVRNTDAWQSAKERLDRINPEAKKDPFYETTIFQNADTRLRRGVDLTEKDERINDRINKADKIAQRYENNIFKGTGFNRESGYYVLSPESDKKYRELSNKKFSYARRMGIAQGGKG